MGYNFKMTYNNKRPNTVEFSNLTARQAQKTQPKTANTNYALKWTSVAFLVCIAIFGIMYLAVNADSIGFPGVSNYIRKSPMAPAFAPFSGKQNILIMGVDSNGSKSDPFKGTRTDTILLVSIDKFGKAVNAISIPRDSKVFLADGHGVNKINSAHAIGGTDLTIKTIKNTFGVNINHYIIVNFNGVKDFVKALGGVTVNVEKRMHYTDRSGGLYIDLYPGTQTLTPEQAEGYLRFRHDAIGDIGRMRRQQWFVKGMVERLKSPDVVARIPSIMQAISKNIQTDMNLYELAGLAAFSKQIDMNNIQIATLPGKPSNHGYISYWILDTEKTQKIIDRLIYREEPTVDSIANPLTVTLLYSANYTDQIPAIKETLKQEGFDVKFTSQKRNAHSQIISHSNRAGFSLISKIKDNIPVLKTAQFIIDPSEYSGDSDYTIILADK
jgi:LCP family protein required for cell wall assembly